MTSAAELTRRVEIHTTLVLLGIVLLASASRLPPGVCQYSLDGGAGTSEAKCTVLGNTGGLGGGGGIMVATPI